MMNSRTRIDLAEMTGNTVALSKSYLTIKCLFPDLRLSQFGQFLGPLHCQEGCASRVMHQRRSQLLPDAEAMWLPRFISRAVHPKRLQFPSADATIVHASFRWSP